MRNKEVLIEGFKKGELSIEVAEEFAKDGYAFICKAGVLVDIILILE